MPIHGLTESDLVSFDNAAAGHDGVLATADGDLVIKPCTAAEVDFYQICLARDEPLLLYMPRFMGTLELTSPEQKLALEQQAEIAAETPTVLDPTSPLVVAKGKKIDTGQAIVLENVAAGFVRPNILDLKLGSKLWADDAPPAKRQRLDEVSSNTTSGSLGFRVAGMRKWNAQSQDYRVYDRQYGRQFDEATIKDAFEEYFSSLGARHELEAHERILARRFRQELEDLRHILERTELRMVGASILMVYEGDDEAFQLALALDDTWSNHSRDHDMGDGEEEEEDEDADFYDDDETPQLCRIVLIDFAHSTLLPGQGCDENVLKGVNGVMDLFDAIC